MTDQIAPTKKIKQMDLKPRDQVTFDYRAMVEPNVTLNDILDPVFWSDVSGQSFNGVMNSIEVVWKDKSQIVDLVVLDYGKAHARVFIKNHYVLNTGAEVVTIDNRAYVLQYGDESKWRVVRKVDSEVLETGLETKELALAALDEYIKSSKG